MKRAIYILLILSLCSLLHGCNDRSDRIADNQHSNTQEITSPLVGAWYSDENGTVFIFSATGQLNIYVLDCSEGDDNTSVISSEETYEITGKNEFETYHLNGNPGTVYEYELSEKHLHLSSASADIDFQLRKAKHSENSESPLIGQWKLLSHGYIPIPSFEHKQSEITYYADGTFVSKHKSYATDETKTIHGRYALIHDGRSIEMELYTYSYWDLEFLCDDVMLITADNSELLYVAQ